MTLLHLLGLSALARVITVARNWKIN